MLLFFIYLVIMIVSAIILVIAGKKLDKLIKYCSSTRILREKMDSDGFKLENVFDFFNRKKFISLFENRVIIDRQRSELIKDYNEFMRAFSVNVLFALFYILYIVYVAFHLHYLFFGGEMSDAAACVAVLLCSVPYFLGFYIAPLFRLVKLNRAAKATEDILWGLIKFADFIAIKILYLIYTGINTVVVLIYLKYAYIPFKDVIAEFDKVNESAFTILFATVIVLGYNMGILRGIAWLLSRCSRHPFIKKAMGVNRSISYEEIYNKIKKTTYFILVTFLLIASVQKVDGAAFYKALGIAFLYDTYFDQKKKDIEIDIRHEEHL